MKKIIIGGLVGSIILFIWQFLSWSLLDLHYTEMAHTDKQDEVLAALNEVGLDEGTYFIPRAPKGASQETMTEMAEQYEGKPWAIISYRDSLSSAMGMNLFRGWATSFVAALLLTWLLLQFAELNMSRSIMASVTIGLIGYLTIPYLKSVWFEGSSWGDLIDAIVSWGLTGAWLGWWLKKD